MKLTLTRCGLIAACSLVLTVLLCWWISVQQKHLLLCNPYWSHCHSISATGRIGAAFWVFKLGALISAVMMWHYWRYLSVWVMDVAMRPVLARWIGWLGRLACIALVCYTLSLGAEQHWPSLSQFTAIELIRRTGVVFFFAFSAFNHLLLLKALPQIPEKNSDFSKSLLYFSTFGLLLLGIVSATLGFLWSDYRYWDNAFEWWFGGFLMLQFLLLSVRLKNP